MSILFSYDKIKASKPHEPEETYLSGNVSVFLHEGVGMKEECFHCFISKGGLRRRLGGGVEGGDCGRAGAVAV